MAEALVFTQNVSDPAMPDVEKIAFTLKNGKLRIIMESQAKGTVSAFTLLEGEFSALIEWLIENAAEEGATPEE